MTTALLKSYKESGGPTGAEKAQIAAAASHPTEVKQPPTDVGLEEEKLDALAVGWELNWFTRILHSNKCCLYYVVCL